MHTEYYTRPRLQKHVIRILWMVPIYAVDAWFALRFRDAREYLDPIRECYEAFVIWSFFAYLMAYLEDEKGDVEVYLSFKPPMKHFPPFKWLLKPWPMGRSFLLQTKKGVMNYVILRPITTAIALITDQYDLYGQGHFDYRKSYIYLSLVTNFSQLWALYCLAQLYWVCHNELQPIRPLSKFICIKAVVFLTFWQSIILAVLVSSGVITDESWSTYDQLGVATGIQDFLICIEMFVAALAHAYAFPPRDYMDVGTDPGKGFIYNVRHMFDLRDVVYHMGEVVESHADTVHHTANAALNVPKQAMKHAAKGFKAAVHAPESLLHYLTSDGSKRPGRSKSSAPASELHDEERGNQSGEEEPNGWRGRQPGVSRTAGEDERLPLLPFEPVNQSEQFTSTTNPGASIPMTEGTMREPPVDRSFLLPVAERQLLITHAATDPGLADSLGKAAEDVVALTDLKWTRAVALRLSY
eukprot:CAMPEP_0119112536 /NCGR_PEP_ID=MMETSP1180-20130426/40661_1 /TAXON_ID=3052 ORGANISM="Chlamydomonas cf sp, Strain CCMP681" /NCGR_SAMPLE_ID=MMETSP1180 /ASSEMBLY_ACC=CAM_ASM_000741 /LENGTH=467 /DNA_ID=CAMNT_0007100083 /DNA_START=261 /DNA_END=1665 /DNA_ORIENTATION=-